VGRGYELRKQAVGSQRRKAQGKEFPKPDSEPDWKYLGTKRTYSSLGEEIVMKTPSMFQWFRILRDNYNFTMFQAVRFALWLAR